MATNQQEIIVQSMNLFVNSNDRARTAAGGQDNGKISVPFKNINFECQENQFLRLTLQQFTAHNQFDRNIAPNTSFSIYIGDGIKTTAQLIASGLTGATQVTDGSLVNAELLLPRYDAYADITLDLMNAIGIALNYIYPSSPASNTSSGYEYKLIRNSGNGRGVPSNGSYLYLINAMPSSSPSIPNNYDNIGYYAQSGEKIFTTQMTIRNKDGSAFPDTYDNSANSTAFGLFFGNNNDTYLQVGAKPTDLSNFQGFLSEAIRCATGQVIDPATIAGDPDFSPDSNTGLGGLYGSLTYSNTGGVANDTLLIQFSQRCPMVLNTEPLLYLRSNLMSNNHATSNFNELQSTPDPTDTEFTNIIAAFPINADTIYYESNGIDMFSMDIMSRNIQNLELFLTDRHGNADWRVVPYNSTTTYTSNISFTALFKISIVERSVIIPNVMTEQGVGLPPPRFTSNVLRTPNNGKDFTTNNINTRMASLQFRGR
jgi:hypothetical protein